MLVTVILAGVVSGSGLLLNDLSKRPRPELIENNSLGSQGAGSFGTGAEQPKRRSLPSRKKKKSESEASPVSIQNQGAAETKAEGALRPDLKSDDARKDRDRSNRKSLEEPFHRHLSNGLTAYHEKNFARAKSELTKAQELKPTAQVVMEALAQVEAAIRLQSIGDLKTQSRRG